MPANLTISTAAKRLGVSIKTLRRWEKNGLVNYIRNSRNQRLIDPSTFEYLTFIKNRDQHELPTDQPTIKKIQLNTNTTPIHQTIPTAFALATTSLAAIIFITIIPLPSSTSNILGASTPNFFSDFLNSFFKITRIFFPSSQTSTNYDLNTTTSSNADTLDGIDSTDLLTINGSLTTSSLNNSATDVNLVSTIGGIKLSTGGDTHPISIASGADITLSAGSGFSYGTGITVDSTTGNVGIGVADPDAMLEIVSGGTEEVLHVSGGDGNCVDGNEAACSINDYAELFPSSEEVEKGDLLVVDPQNNINVKRSSSAYQQVIGIVSQNPALTIEGGSITAMYGNGYVLDPLNPAVALAGRVPVKIDPDSQPIQPGDAIAASDIQGMAQKATQAGYIIGTSLESWSPGQEKVKVFINPSWYNHWKGDFLLTSLGELIDTTEQETVQQRLSALTQSLTQDLLQPEDPEGSDPSILSLLESLANRLTGAEKDVSELQDRVLALSLKDPVLTESSASASLASRLTEIEDVLGATTSGSIPEASSSAGLEQLDQLGQLEIPDDLTITGTTYTDQLSVAGLTTLGTLSIDDNSINTLTSPLKLQDLALADIEIFGGKILLEKDGTIRSKQLCLDDICLNSEELKQLKQLLDSNY